MIIYMPRNFSMELNDIYPEISSADGMFIIDFEYGNGNLIWKDIF